MSNQRRILVVDDESNARAALAELLRDEGFEVETAAHGFDGLGKLSAFSPHVVIADLQMPGMDGTDLVARLLQTADPPSVIVLTTYGETAVAIEAMREGARDYLTKPIQFGELLVVLGKVLEHRDLAHEVAELRAQQPLSGERVVSR